MSGISDMDWRQVCALDTRAREKDFRDDDWDSDNSCNYSSDGSKLLDAENFPDKVTVRQGTKVICDGAFAFQPYMSDRRIGEEVPEDERVSYLERIVLPEGLTHIGKEAFRECGWMKSIRLPSTLQFIGESAFAECWELRSVSCPSSLVAIGDDAFSNCASLTKVRLNKGLKAIGAGAFFCCESLGEITLPAGVEFIGEDAFSYCTSLKKIFVPARLMDRYLPLLPKALHRRLRPLK